MTDAVRVGDLDPTPELDEITDYCWAPHRLPGRVSTVYCSWRRFHDGDHVSADVGGPVVAVWTDVAYFPGRYWSPRDRRPWVLGPKACGQSPEAWTDAMAAGGRDLQIRRQCSIGWHDECSDPDGESCRCICHAEGGAQ